MADVLLERIATADPRVVLLNREIPPLPQPTQLWPPFPEQLVGLVPSAEVLLTLRLPPGVPESSPQLRWIHSQAAGIDYHAQAPGLAKADVIITSSSGAHARPLSETVIGAIIALAKGFPQAIRRQGRREWLRYTPGDLGDKIVGVIGTGKIGTAIAERCTAMGMRAWGVRRSAPPRGSSGTDQPFEKITGPEGFLEALEGSDFIVLCAPKTPETMRMFGREQFAAMKRGSYFINVARGDLVDEQALVHALQAGHLGGAYLDVFEQEPLPVKSPLWDMPNVLLTAHSGAGSTDRDERVVEIFLENLRQYLDRRPLINVFDAARGY